MVNYKLGLWENYKITKPIRLIELFAGYGSQALALKRLNVDFEHYQVVEFDKYAIKTYNALHGTNFETQDITKLQNLNISNTDKYEYIMTYSFPCTDLSIAGKGLGMKKGTRSGLLWEVERLLSKAKELPQILLMENVTQVHGSRHKEDFDKWINFLTHLGYSNIWQDLNAKDYGVPQNRDRTFMVSILGEYDYQFPRPQTLNIKLKDLLESNINDKYYISDKMYDYLSDTKNRNGFVRADRFRPHDLEKSEFAFSITTANGSRPTDNFVKEYKNHKHKLANRLAKSKHIKPYTIVNHSYVNISQKDNSRIVDKDYIQSDNGVCCTLTTRSDTLGVKTKDYRIRKLTPRECLRFMGLYDSDIDKIINVNSNAQLYKQAGNSIVVQVLERIFEGLL